MLPDNDKCVLYVIRATGGHKVGITTNFQKRFLTIQAHNPKPITCAAFRYVPRSRQIKIEKAIHAELADFHIHGEWFSASRGTIIHVIDRIIATEQAKVPWDVKRGDCNSPVWAGYRME